MLATLLSNSEHCIQTPYKKIYNEFILLRNSPKSFFIICKINFVDFEMFVLWHKRQVDPLYFPNGWSRGRWLAAIITPRGF